jgi:hypothetical protein
VREAYGDDAARLVRENPDRLDDDIHGIGFVTADSLRLMLCIAPTSTFRLRAALKYVLGLAPAMLTVYCTGGCGSDPARPHVTAIAAMGSREKAGAQQSFPTSVSRSA